MTNDEVHEEDENRHGGSTPNRWLLLPPQEVRIGRMPQAYGGKETLSTDKKNLLSAS